MSNSYRIRTEVGKDKSIKVQLEQDFEFLEILSLKLVQSQVYARPCSDYGVVIGRVSVNDGFGLPNCKVSIFVPLSDLDSLNPIIADLYPYRSLSDVNDDGYRYNLLPYTKSYSAHAATGTFFTREDVLIDTNLIEVYDKYYKYNAVTNDSGDFMIFGVPVGTQTIHLDVDLSDIGEFSLSPQDLIRMGRATEAQVSGTEFRTSSNLNALPQLVTINRTVEVEPFWGQEQICNIGISRVDFDLTTEANIVIEPTAIFIGSLFSDDDSMFQKKSCRPKLKQGNLCSLQAGPGEILAIRQTIFQDSFGRPILETTPLDQGGQVIDDNGAWMIDIPMNLDYVVTNEFGERIFSNDPKKGIPTKGKYRFKVKWNQSPSLSENTKRGYFLIPNVKEHGWSSGSVTDPLTNGTPSDYANAVASYSFSLDWNDYGDTGTTEGIQMIQSAIDCEDRFYPMTYNKVYTISQLIDKFRYGVLPGRILGIKHILDSECESENNKFPTNDAFYRFDLIYYLFLILLFIITPILMVIVVVNHIIAWLIELLANMVCDLATIFSFLQKTCDKLREIQSRFMNLKIPNIAYPDCDLCQCGENEQIQDAGQTSQNNQIIDTTNQNNSTIGPYLAQTTNNAEFNTIPTQGSDIQGLKNVLAGETFDFNNPSYRARVPQVNNWSGGSENVFTTSLPLSERINLFNAKAKYFDDPTNTNNPGGGVNRIKVQFGDPILNAGIEHYDNITCLLLDPQWLNEFNSGDIISFQAPSLTQDANITNTSSLVPIVNQFGTTSITGTPINITPPVQGQISLPTPITITYSDFQLPYAQQSVTYQIEQRINDANIQKFPFDLEYFQIITGMTYSEFSGMCNTTPISNFSEYTLNNRFLSNSSTINVLQGDGSWNTPIVVKPLELMNDFQNFVVLFLVRGVDPHSSRITATYDLSRLFGYNTYNNIIVSGASSTTDPTKGFKMNWPIQGKHKAIDHQGITDNTSTDTYSTQSLFYNSFHFLPNYGTGFFSFSGFSTTLPSYYSSLDNNRNNFSPDGGLIDIVDNFCNQTTYGLEIDNPSTKNLLLYEFSVSNTTTCGTLTYYTEQLPTITPSPKRGYLHKEKIDGISGMYLKKGSTPFTPNSNCDPITPDINGIYYAPKYPNTLSINFVAGTGVTDNKIVMRSDRLFTSTITTDSLENSFAGQSNQSLRMYILTDQGLPLQLVADPPPIINNGDTNNTGDTPSNVGQNILSTFSCGGYIPLGCYYVPPPPNDNEINVRTPSPSTVNVGLPEQSSCNGCDGCYTNETDNQAIILRNGCYVLVTKPLSSLSKDLRLVIEWKARIQIMFAACRNVWSHYFGNNWINGTLYAYPFKNERNFDANNQPYSVYCRQGVFLHPTSNNFYYRSSPYDGTNTSGFTGSDAPTGILGNFGGNAKNLKTPTTIMDLGPRTSYLQEIIMSDEYDGYVMNKLGPTSYNDVEEILNFLILSRLVNASFIELILGSAGQTAIEYFNKRGLNPLPLIYPNRQVDGDYAQAISINSELGVLPFTLENYPSLPGQDYTFINSGNASEPVMGIFFRSDTQLRDFIAPKRTIINPTTPLSNIVCSFNNFPVFSQDVPFYQWTINQPPDYDSIFGAQSNDWYSEPTILPPPLSVGSGNSFFHRRYQSLDRLPTGSRYFETINTNQSNFFKGYIYSVTPSATSDTDLDGSVSTWNPSSTLSGQRPITAGSPFFFYFGLKKGKTAWDIFARKWIKFETIVD